MIKSLLSHVKSSRVYLNNLGGRSCPDKVGQCGTMLGDDCVCLTKKSDLLC